MIKSFQPMCGTFKEGSSRRDFGSLQPFNPNRALPYPHIRGPWNAINSMPHKCRGKGAPSLMAASIIRGIDPAFDPLKLQCTTGNAPSPGSTNTVSAGNNIGIRGKR